MSQLQLISQLPEVSSCVISDASGALVESAGSIDGETAGAVNAFCAQALGKAGELLGLGELHRVALVGSGTGCLITVHGDVLVGAYFDPTKSYASLEKKLDDLLRR